MNCVVFMHYMQYIPRVLHDTQKGKSIYFVFTIKGPIKGSYTLLKTASGKIECVGSDTVSVICKSISNCNVSFNKFGWKTYFVNRSLIEEISQSPHLDPLIWKRKVDLSYWQCRISHNYEVLIRFTGRVKIKIFTISI